MAQGPRVASRTSEDGREKGPISACIFWGFCCDLRLDEIIVQPTYVRDPVLDDGMPLCMET